MKANAVVLNPTNSAVRVLGQALLVIGFALATALAAQVKIPVPGTIVPMTLQTAIVVLAGLTIGARKGALSQALYVGAGALGLPFFAGAAGVAVLFGPTGGYLVGFVLAAWAAGALNDRFGRGFARKWLVAFAASILIFIPGMVQLKFFTASSWSQAFMMGVAPFIVGDLIKTTLAALAATVGAQRS